MRARGDLSPQAIYHVNMQLASSNVFVHRLTKPLVTIAACSGFVHPLGSSTEYIQ
jgi:hypothetical protein